MSPLIKYLVCKLQNISEAVIQRITDLPKGYLGFSPIL